MRMSALLATMLLLQACGSSGSSSGSNSNPSAGGTALPNGTSDPVTSVPQSCVGEVPLGENLVVNGNFVSAPDEIIEPGADIDGWVSGYRYMGFHPTTLLSDNEIAAFTGFLNFNLVKQKQFEGDPDFGIAGSTHYVFSDGGKDILTVWRQTVSGLQVGSQYAFTVYASNVLIRDWKQEPVVSLRVNGEELISQLIQYDGVEDEYVPSQDKWTRVSVSFIASDDEVELEIVDTQSVGTVNDLAITAVSLKGCS